MYPPIATPTPGRRAVRVSLVAGTVFAVGLGLVGPAGVSNAAEPRETPQSASARAQDLGALPGEGAVSGVVAKWLGEKIAGAAVGKAFNWIVDAIVGAPGAAEQLALLNQIDTKLDEIKKQLDYVELKLDELTTDLDNTKLETDIKQLRNWSADVTDFYKFTFAPMVERAKELNEAKLSGGDVALAQQRLDSARLTFLAKYALGEPTYSPLGRKIHNYLLPGATTSMLANKGKVMLDTHRFLTAQDSIELRDLYTAYAEQAALATWMKAEYYRALGDEVNLQQVMDEYQSNTAAEEKNLAPLIPSGAIVDLGKKGTKTTNNAIMWIPSTSDRLSYRPGGSSGIDQALAALNTQSGMKNWKVPLWQTNPADPTYPNMASLVGGPGGFDAKTDKNQLSTYLRSLNPTDNRWKGISDNWRMFYTSTQVSQKVECYHWGLFKVHINRVWPRFPTYVALNNRGLGAAPAPLLPSETVIPKEEPTTQACQQFGDDYFYVPDGGIDPETKRPTYNRGAFVAGRDTGMMPQDYMAQGAATVSLRAVQARGKLRVEVNPKRKAGKNWAFTIKRFHNKTNTWQKVRRHTTKGAAEVRTVNVDKGRYRVHIKFTKRIVGGFTRPVRIQR